MPNSTSAWFNTMKASGLSLLAGAFLAGSMLPNHAAAQVAADYSMTVEEHAVHTTGDLAGMTTYRFYINMANSTDFLSSIYGNEDNPFYLTTSDGFYNNGFSSGSTAGGVNPAFFAVVPDMAFDSWVTIGIESSPTPPYTAVSTVESADQPWSNAFNALDPASGSDVVMDDFTGGAWYVLNGTPNGLPDPTTMRTLFLQLTTSGTISGTINAQVFPLGIGADQLQLTYSFDGVGEITAAVDGCTDEAACNYDAGATADDGTCTYPEAGYGCDGNCLADADADGICDANEVPGCSDAEACNYDSGATDDDGSCVFPDAGLDCDGNCLNDADLDGVCDENEVAGCTDATACNYDALATDEDGSCTFPAEAYLDCNGDCLNDANNNGICDEEDTSGCMDAGACNYSPAATSDDGSCEFTSCLGCTDANACNFDASATQDDGSCVEAAAGYDCDGNCLADADMDGVCDGDEVMGCQDVTACNYDAAATDAGDCTFAAAGYDCSGNCLNDADMDGVCDEFEVAGCTDLNACNYDAAATNNDGSCSYPSPGYDCSGECITDTDGDGVCDLFEVSGCTDGMACNYDMGATDDDGSCTYPDAGYDCDGACLADADMDGVCDGFEIVGCQDDSACNYDAAATDAGDCTYPEAGYDCTGACLADADMDGVCDEFEVVGCQDELACNYDAAATDEGDCTYPESGYDCAGNCLADADGDGVCDEFEVAGCTDEAAPNYNPEATDDDGSCVVCDLVADATVSGALCAGSADGVVDVLVTDLTGEAGTLTFTLGSLTQASGLFTGLAAGTYVVEVGAENGCTTSVELVVTEPEALVITVDQVVNEDSAAAGSIDVTITGGTQPYVFAWVGPGDFTSADEDVTGLVAGEYTLTVFDDHQCSTDATVEVDDVLRVELVDELVWTAYPNPVTATLWLSVDAAVNQAVVRVVDMQGRAVLQQEAVVVNGLVEVNAASWAAGQYVVSVVAAERVWSTQVTVQH